MVAAVRNLTSPNWIKAKGFLFLLLGLLSGGLLFFDHPSAKVGLLLIISIWSFCRLYYFCFYAIEHYVDPGFKFSGILAFARYLIRAGGEKPGLR